MKRFFFFLIVLSVCSISFAQTRLIINKTNGTSDSFLLTDIKNITFSGGETVTDIDGNVYRTVKIGSQWWMAENLKVTHYRNGDDLPNVTAAGEWTSSATGAYCNYNNIPANAEIYGCLYNGYAVGDSRSIAPAGWHVPTDAEWQTLVNYLGGDNYAGGRMKMTGTLEASTGLWYSPNQGATNESGFSALPGGYRYSSGSFYPLGDSALFWSSPEFSDSYAWYRGLYFNDSLVSRDYYYEGYGFSVRCVRD